jgi:glutamate-1-semialdehyde 2,1-aminomutase/spore coat polysaccharide biosynthesis protein SpsF
VEVNLFFSFTFGGEALSLAAARATIAEMANGNVIGHLWAQGRRLKDGYNTLAREFRLERFTRCVGLPPRTVFTFQDEVGAESLVLGSLFQQECIKRRVLLSGGQNICYSHGNAEIEHTFRAYRGALEILSKAIDSGNPRRWLEGEPVQPVFRPM